MTLGGVALLGLSLILGALGGGGGAWALFALAFFWLTPCILAGVISLADIGPQRFASRNAKPT
jgi:hypothetical protein